MEPFFTVECIALNAYIVVSRAISASLAYTFASQADAEHWCQVQTQEIFNNAKLIFLKRFPGFPETVSDDGRLHPKLQATIKMCEADLLLNHFN